MDLFTEHISVFRNRDAANTLIDYLIETEVRIYLWIDISPVNQTRFDLTMRALLCESA